MQTYSLCLHLMLFGNTCKEKKTLGEMTEEMHGRAAMAVHVPRRDTTQAQDNRVPAPWGPRGPSSDPPHPCTSKVRAVSHPKSSGCAACACPAPVPRLRTHRNSLADSTQVQGDKPSHGSGRPSGTTRGVSLQLKGNTKHCNLLLAAPEHTKNTLSWHVAKS